MNATDLPDKTQQKKELFRALMAQYAKPLYQNLYQKYNDHDIAVQAVKAAFHELYMIMQKTSEEAAAEELLLRLAMAKQQALLCQKAEDPMPDSHAVQQTDAPTEADTMISAEQNEKTEQKCDAESNMYPGAAQACNTPADHPSLQTVCSNSDDTGNKLCSNCENTAKAAEKNDAAVPKGTKFKLVLLTAAAVTLLWVIAGLLMDMRIIPQMDLGYEWFNLNVAAWF